MPEKPDLKKWADIREQGRRNYIFKYGVIRFGLSTWAIMTLYVWIFQPFDERLVFTFVSLFTFPLAGLIWGRWMWYYFEKLYARVSPSYGDQL